MNKQRYTDEQIIKALVATQGLVYHAAAKVGCDADTIYIRAKKSAAVRKCIEETRGGLIDTAESKLFAAVKRGQPWAVQTVLKTLGRDRGYVERSESNNTTTLTAEMTHAVKDPQAALAPYAAVLARVLAGGGEPPAAPEVPQQPVHPPAAPPQAGDVPPA